MIFFNPAQTTAAIVTCGGLSPGLNNVIRSIVFELSKSYGVSKIFGIPFGFSGLTSEAEKDIKLLTPASVRDIHTTGGSILGSSRGPVPAKTMVDTLQRLGISILFCVGGDGTLRGAQAIVKEVLERDLKIAVIGIPKTIDNDVPFVFQSFGFATAVEKAREVIHSAAIEAHSYRNAIALVKLMGRDAGFISVYATLAAQEADFTLIPEVPFQLNGKGGLLELLEDRLSRQGSAIIVLSEGAGQDLFVGQPNKFDSSGNRMQHDIGQLLRTQIEAHFNTKKTPFVFRYFDPSYSIRAVPANVSDAFFCDRLARAAVHAAMAGKTDLLIGSWYNNLTHVPMGLSTSSKKRVSPTQEIWRGVLEVTGQPGNIGVPTSTRTTC